MLTPEKLKEVLSYDKDTGVFTWRANKGRARAGSVAGRIMADGRYILIKIDQKEYLAHRLAWFYTNGCWPNGIIDHIDEDTRNNAICNLRVVSKAENKGNATCSTNITGFRGVRRNNSKYTALITLDGKQVHLGTFPSAIEAHEAYRAAHIAHYGRTSKLWSTEK